MLRYKKYRMIMMIASWLAFSILGQAQTPDIRVHDPVVIKEDSTYHLYCTGKGIAHFTSKDLVTWTEGEQIFTERPTWSDYVVPDFKNHIWAPDIILHKGIYYLYYSVSAFGKNTSAIGVTTNKSLNPSSKKYKWEDKGIVIQSQPNRDLWNAIDPNIVIDEKGVAWMAFGSFWDGMKLVKLDPTMIKIAEPQEWYTIARRNRSFELSDKNPGDASIEAPFIFKKGDWYYLFVSWDYCCRGVESTYKVVMGRSKSVEGPYFDKDEKNMFHGGGSLLVQGNEHWNGVGHCSVYTFDNKDFLFMHAYDAKDNGKSKLKVKNLKWSTDGWPYVEGKIE